MKSRRFFVTTVLVLATIKLTACKISTPDGSASDPNPVSLGSAGDPNAITAQRNLRVAAAVNMERELALEHIYLEQRPDNFGRPLSVERMAESYNWMRLSLQERKAVAQKLSRYITSNWELLKRESASLYESSLKAFEEHYGENFDPPKTNSEQPVYNWVNPA